MPGAGRSCAASSRRWPRRPPESSPARPWRRSSTSSSSDPARAVHGEDALRGFLQDLMDRTIAALDGPHFDIPAPVRKVEAMIAPPGGAAAPYYTGPSEDFSRPGRTWYPTQGRTVFPLWGEISTCYHEGVPGHHLQIGQVRYRKDQLTRFQRTVWISGHGEGWALYAERLMDELGYFESARAPARLPAAPAAAGRPRGGRHRHAPRAPHPRRGAIPSRGDVDPRARPGSSSSAGPALHAASWPASSTATLAVRVRPSPTRSGSVPGSRLATTRGAARSRLSL